ncbi:MAG: CDP-paratose 2-epimerase [Acidobacteria bacterium]|nr:CDP-paratose 2-epimerase [Acidobacteriota bacterium]
MSRPVRTFHHRSSVWLPRPLAEVFPFFADAGNLQRITPPWVHFRIRTPLPIEMGPGALIEYTIRVHGAPLRWTTEITRWEPPYGFADEQIRGPYRKWSHTHRFREADGGTLCEDHVEYAVYGGRLIHKLFVEKDVERIFAYRRKCLEEIFGRRPDQSVPAASGVIAAAR